MTAALAPALPLAPPTAAPAALTAPVRPAAAPARPPRFRPLRAFLAELLGTPAGLILAMPAVGLLVIGMRADWSSGLAGLQRGATVVAVVAAVTAVVMMSRAVSRARRTVVLPIKSGGHGTKHAAWHEAGHFEVGRAVGAHVSYAEIYPCGAGFTAVTMHRRATVAERVAVDVAGHVASGSTSGCTGGLFFDNWSDFAWKRRDLARLPKDQRAAV